MFRRILPAFGLVACCAAQAADIGQHTNLLAYPIQDAASLPALAVSPRGDAALVWAEIAPDVTYDIRLGIGLTTAGESIQVNTTTAGMQDWPSVAIDATGDIVVVWRDPNGIYGRRFSLSGQPAGDEFQISVSPWDSLPKVAMDAFGNFVVAWERFDRDLWNWQILARRYLADGTPLDVEFEVDSAAPGEVMHAAVAMGAWGEFVIAWEQADGSQPSVFVKSFAADGTPDGAGSVVGTLPAQARGFPAVGMDAQGRFVVAWNNKRLDGSSTIQAQQYLAGGTPLAMEFDVDVENHSEWPHPPAVGMGPLGDFIVAWGVSFDARGAKQQFAPDGARVGAEDLVTDIRIPNLAAAMDADGDAFVASIASYNGEPVVLRYAGREPIDLGVTITDLADPIAPGDSIRHHITITNHHPGRAETGIAEIDSAIGFAGQARAYSYLSGNGLDFPWGEPEPCHTQSGWACPAQLLAPGASETWLAVATANEPTQAERTAELMSSQYDPDSSNDFAAETTTVACAEGTGPGTLVIVGAPASIEEGDTAVVEVERRDGTCGAASAGYVIRTTPRTFQGDGTLSWGPGESGIRSIVINTTDDNIHELTHEITVTLNWTTTAPVAGPASVTIAQADNDPIPTVSISPMHHVITENILTPPADFILTLSHPSDRDIIVPITFGGTATRIHDYGPSDEVRILKGFLQATFRIRAIIDSMDEPEEVITVEFGAPTDAILTGPTSGTVTIQDADPPSSVRIRTEDFAASEGATQQFVRVELDRPSGYTITVPLLWSGSATNGSDLSAATTATFAPHQTTVWVPVNPTPDGLDEDTESAILTLGEPTNAVHGTDTSFTLSILDIDPPPSVSFASAAQAAREGPDAQVTITAALSAVSGREVRVLLSASGSAARGTDWSVANDWLVIPSGSRTASKTVNILNNGVIELDEQVTFTMGSFTNVEAGAITTHTLTIRDNDPEFLGVRENLQENGAP